MFTINRLPFTTIVVIDEKTNKRVNFRPVDQFPAQEFNKGANGFPANDITLLSRATNTKEAEIIIQRLEEVKVDNPDNSGKSDVQILKEIVPSWVNTPYLLDQFVQYYNSTHPIPLSTDDTFVSNDPTEKPVDQQIIESV